jgi:hypothetical protein
LSTDYVNDSNETAAAVVNVDALDTNGASQVDYVAATGPSTINATSSLNVSLNLGNNSDLVHLGSGADTVTLGGGQSQIALGAGNDLVVFQGGSGAGTVASNGTMDNIVYFAGAGDHDTPGVQHDFLAFYGYGAGASLQLRSNDGAGHEAYNIVNSSGVMVGEFAVAVLKDADGTFHTLSAATDYHFYS